MPKGKNEKLIGLMKDELGGKIITKFVVLKEKNNSYLKDQENYENCFEATQLENEIYHLRKNKTYISSSVCYKSKHTEFIRSNILKLKTQQRFKSERHKFFTEEINKIALSSNYDERMQSIDPIGTYPYGTSKDLAGEKEKIKCNNVIKRWKK